MRKYKSNSSPRPIFCKDIGAGLNKKLYHHVAAVPGSLIKRYPAKLIFSLDIGPSLN